MTLGFKNHGSPEDAGNTREPLIDINPEPAPADEPVLQVMGRRKRLSDVQTATDEPAPQPKPQRRRLCETAQIDSEEAAPESPAASVQVGLIDIQPDAAILKTPRADDGTIETAKPLNPSLSEQWIAELRSRQSLSIAALGGLLAVMAGALAWTIITAIVNVPTTGMAIGMGLLVGGAVRFLGRGLDKSFGCLGAGLSLLTCILGNCLANSTFIARDVGLPVTSVLAQISPGALPRLVVATFHPIDLLFYGLALYLGYRLSFRRLRQAQVAAVPARA